MLSSHHLHQQQLTADTTMSFIHYIFFLLLQIIIIIPGFDCHFESVGPSFIQEPPAKVEFINEIGTRINCTAKGKPTPSIRWTSNQGSLIDIPGLRYTSQDGTLILPPISKESFRPDAIYRCVASNSFGTIVSADVQVSGVSQLHLQSEVHNVNAFLGFPVILDCSIPSHIRAYVTISSWIRDKSLLITRASSLSDKYHISLEGQLIIWDLSKEDAFSSYQCQILSLLTGEAAMSSAGKILLRAENEIIGPPVIQHKMPRAILKENERVVVPCVAYGEPKPYIRWYRRLEYGLVEIIAYSDASSVDGMFLRNSALVINNAKESHSGIYTCNATNALGNDAMEVQIHVALPLQVSLEPPRVNVALGKNVSLSCLASAGEPQWLKDGVLLRPGSFSGRIRIIGKSNLQIIEATKEDQGMWQCMVKVDRETKQSSAELWVGDSVVAFKYKFINQTVQEYQQVSFRCSATGPVKWIWTLDGFPLPQSDRFLIGQYTNVHREVISHVNITSVRNSDSGEYTCTGESENGDKITHSGRLNVYGKLMIRPMTDIFTVGGKELRITCPVGGYPIDEIKWWKDDFPLPTNYDRQHVVGFKEGTLVIEKVDKKMDSGKYTCKAKRLDQRAEESVVINIKEPPIITKFTFLPATEGERVSVSCVVKSGEVDSITWVKDNQIALIPTNSMSLPSSMKISIHYMNNYTSSLSIDKLDAEIHNGLYTCVAKNKLSTTNHSATLVVQAQPRISPFFFDDNIIEGMSSVEVLCHSQGDDLSFQWYKDDKPLVTNQDGFKVINFSPFSTILTLTNISSQMTANYTCEASNAKDSSDLFTASLLVKVAPSWTTEPADQSIAAGSYLAVNCQASGFPKPSIKWQQAIFSLESKEYREVGYRTPGILSVENGTMIIGLVKKEHEGTYLCEANNGIGNSPLRKLIRLTVNAAPRMKARPPKEMVKMGISAKLLCQAEGDEPILFTWKFKGVLIDLTKSSKYLVTSGSPKSSELEIIQVSADDRGDFLCVAENAFGSSELLISLLVQEKPPTPIHFRALEESSRSVLLSWWMPTYEETSVLDFILSFREETGNWSEEIRKKFIPGDQMTATVDNLSPSRIYIFRISARNQMGTSEFSENLKITTDSEPPSSPPLYVSVEALSSQQLLMKWQPPSKEHRNGKILGYLINYRKRSENNGEAENWINQLVASEDILSLIIKGLDKFTEYEIYVQAFNSKGRSPNSTLIVAVTREDVPSAPPMEITCIALSSHNLQVTWQPPPKQNIHGRIQGYRVSLEAVDESDNSNNAVELESKVVGLSTVIHGLLHFTNYSVQVAAVTSAGDGIISSPTYCQTTQSVPEAPAELKAVHDRTKGSVILSWLPPKRLNGVILQYHIYIKNLASRFNGDNSVRKRSVPSHVWTYELTGLNNANDKYKAWVTGETISGEGPPTISPVIFSMNPSIGSETKSIISFGRNYVVAWRSDVIFHCTFVGSADNVVWKRKDQIIGLSQRIQILNDSSLFIKNCGRKDSDNYTCIVKQNFDSDRIVYNLQVQVPPGPPLLHSTFNDFTSIRLQWKLGDNGGSRILGFSLNFREENGEWEEIRLGRKVLTHDLHDLSCGTNYEFFITSFNKIGDGSPSEILKLNTKGLVTLPSAPDFIETNSSSILLSFVTWNITECQINNLNVDYKIMNGNWISVGNHITLQNKVIHIHNIKPDSNYVVRIRLLNKATEISKDYLVSTAPLKEEPNSGNFSGNAPFLHSISLILLLLMIMLVIASLAIGGIILYVKKRSRLEKMDRSSLSQHDTGQGFMKSNDFSILHAKHYPDDKIPEIAEDICPYATFHLPEAESCSANYGDKHHRRDEITGNIRLVMRDSTLTRAKSKRKSRRNEDSCSGESEEYDSYGSDSDYTSKMYTNIMMTPSSRPPKRENLYFNHNDKMCRGKRDWDSRGHHNSQKQKYHVGYRENHYHVSGKNSIPDEVNFIYSNNAPKELLEMNCDLMRLEGKHVVNNRLPNSSKLPSSRLLGSNCNDNKHDVHPHLNKEYTINV